MTFLDNYIFYIILYLIFSTLFNEYYKISTEKMKNSGSITVLIEFLSAIICMIMIPLFEFRLPTNMYVYLMLGLATIFYTIQDRLSTVARSKIEASTYSVLKQLSTVFMIVLGLLFFKEPFDVDKVIGAILIIISNIIVFYERKKVKLNKHVLLGILANLSLTVALFIDVNYSKQFNLAIYILITSLIPAFIIFIVERLKIKNIKEEYEKGNKKAILITSVSWTLMMIAKLKAYQLGQVIIVAPLCSLTVIFNIIFSYYHLKEKNNLIKKVVGALLIMIGILLIKI